ncbi:MAG: DUF445 domain-containing protein [bacterium]|nr:DUF445 domain-containing protein [Candidatus Kapabacteria bacterium]
MQLTPGREEKARALRRMKAIATGAFVLMTAVFFLTEPLGTTTLVWLIRWDHINAFAEASMVGALADWFAVVALFRHPLGIPIWHTAIIPRKKNEIGRNLGSFVEQRLLSIENLSVEIGRFSASSSATTFLAEPANRERAATWATDGLRALTNALDDSEVEALLGDIIKKQARSIDAAAVLGGGLELITASGRHHIFLDQALHRIAEWIPSRRDMIHEFIERSLQRVFKWGRKLIPSSAIDRATEQVLEAIIDVIREAAIDPNHPMRNDLSSKLDESILKLKNDPDWIEQVNTWKNDLLERPELRTHTSGLWAQVKEWLLTDLDREDSVVRGYALRAIESLYNRLMRDEKMRDVVDERLQKAAVTFLSSHHHAIGALIQRVVDAWDGEQLSEELELNLGRDLQYIRLNGTFIGGLVGLIIHLIR